MDILVFALLLFVPGIIAAKVYSFITNCNRDFNMLNSLAYDLIIHIINIIGLYYFRGMETVQELMTSLDCLSFSRKYALLSILIGLILAVITGLIRRFVFWWRRCD